MRFRHTALFLAFAATAGRLYAAPAPGDVLAALVSYEFGQDRTAWSAIESQLVDASPEVQQEAERRLMACLRSPEATHASRQFACRLLRQIGSDRSVPVLAGLLGDAELSHMARFALERADSPAAVTALREALPKVSGQNRVGVITSLGEVRDAASVPLLVGLLDGGERAVARAAINALGHIGGADAAQVLTARLDRADTAPQATRDSLLCCAERLAEDGLRDRALSIYELLRAPDHPEHVRTAALAGVVSIKGADAVPTLIDLLTGADARQQAFAAQFVRELEGVAVTKAFADQLPKLMPAAQISLIDALVARGDPAACPALRATLTSDTAEVQMAGVSALSALGESDDIAPLARFAVSAEGKARDAAISAISQLRGEDVHLVLSQGFEHPDADIRAVLIRAAAMRGVPVPAERLLAAAKAPNLSVRLAALAALPTLVTVDGLPQVLSLLATTRDQAESQAIESALVAIAQSAPDRRGAEALAAATSETAPVGVRRSLLRVLSRLGGEAALAVAGKAVHDEEIADTAVRALCDWPDTGALPLLLALSQDGDSPVHRVLALRAALRLLDMPSERTSAEAVELYGRALALATRPDEQRLAFAGIATLATAEAAQLLRPHLRSPQAGAEASLALAKLARTLTGTAPAQATVLAAEAKAASDNRTVQEESDAVIALVDAMKDFVLDWLVTGPHTKGGVEQENLLGTAFAPENGHGKEVDWRPMPIGTDPERPWLLDLGKAVGGDRRAAYLRTYVHSSHDRDLLVKLGSDDAVKVWMNRRCVHANNAFRGCEPDTDRVLVRLSTGWNELLVKIVQGGGDWQGALKLVQPDGAHAEDIQIKARLSAEQQAQIAPSEPARLMFSWTMDGGTAAEDASRFAVAGVAVGEPVPGVGVKGQCIVLDGVDDELRAAAPQLPVAAGEAWSLNMFVWLDKQPAELTMIGGFGDVTSASPVGCQRYLVKYKNGIHFWGANVDVNPGVPFDVGRWQMVTITYDGTAVRIYKDARELIASPETLAPAGSFVVLGPRDHWKKGTRFAGKIDEFTIWSGPLTPEQIADLATPGSK